MLLRAIPLMLLCLVPAACGSDPTEADAAGDLAPDAPTDQPPDLLPDQLADSGREPGPAPLLESLEPSTGPLSGGQQITGRGRHFETPTEVLFADTEALSVRVIDPRALSILVPAGQQPGPVNVTVRTRNGTDVLEAGYVYIPSTEPFVEHLDPTRGDIAGGEEIAVIGQNFPTEDRVQVIFGTVSAPEVRLDNETAFTVVTPPNEYGTVDVTFNFAGLVRILPNAFLYLTDLAVDEIVPNVGPIDGGTDVLLVGAGLVDGVNLTVHFGVNLADPSAYDLRGDSALVVTPPGPEGAVDVTAEGDNGRVVIEDGFTYGGSQKPEVGRQKWGRCDLGR